MDESSDQSIHLHQALVQATSHNARISSTPMDQDRDDPDGSPTVSRPTQAAEGTCSGTTMVCPATIWVEAMLLRPMSMLTVFETLCPSGVMDWA